jgi:hypothetical protein
MFDITNSHKSTHSFTYFSVNTAVSIYKNEFSYLNELIMFKENKHDFLKTVDDLKTKTKHLKINRLDEKLNVLKDIFNSLNNAKEPSSVIQDLHQCIGEIENLILTSNPIVNGKNNLLKKSTVVNQMPLIHQVAVDQQNEEETEFRAENCGYHALKNMLCLLTILSTGLPLQGSFQDKKLFNQFYEHYAIPLLKDLPKGKRDATTPKLREIIDHFLHDPYPPEDFLALQKALKNTHERHLGIFTAFPDSNETELQFGLFDEAGFKDADKLIQFLQRPGADFFVCPIGNVKTGHWYTVAILKSEDGRLEFFGCDSLESSQRGEASPLGKLCCLFDKNLTTPNNFHEHALLSFIDTFKYYGDWLDQNGFAYLPEDSAKLITLTNLPEQCMLALDHIVEKEWPLSSNIEHLLKLHKIEKILRFYARELPENDLKEKICFVLSKLADQFDLDRSIETLISNTLVYLESKINSSKGKNVYPLEKTKSVFAHMHAIYKERKLIVLEKDPISRENYINEKICSGIETGFITGKTAIESQKSLEHRTSMLLITFQKAMKKGKEEEFYLKISGGDSCLTEVTGRVEEFLAELNQIDCSQELLKDKIFQQLDSALSVLIGEMCEDAESVDMITSKDINPSDLAMELKKFSGPKIIPFCEYLQRMGFSENKENIDWENAIAQLVQSKDFPILLSRGKAIAKLFF